MSIRKKRIVSWVVWFIVACILFVFDNYNIIDTLFKEKTTITVCAPEDMENALNAALKTSGLKSDYKIEITSNPNANICVSYGKENDSSYTKFAFSPFIIAYTSDDDYLNALKNSNILIPSEFQKDYYELDFLKVINEILKEGNWSNLGIEGLDKIKIFYPSKETIYWNDFYDFMLVTVNNGIYPETENELKNSISTINKFINSPYTEEVSDFYEKVSRVGGFPESAFFILPEKSVFDIYFSNTNYTFPVNILYPTVTVYFNYYIKGDDLGNNIISAFESSKFYSKLKNESYRSTKDSNINLNSNRDFIYGRRNVYNVIKIPDNKITKYLEAQ